MYNPPLSLYRFEPLVNYLAWKLLCTECDCWKLEMLKVFPSWYFLQVSWWQAWQAPGALNISMNTDANWPGQDIEDRHALTLNGGSHSKSWLSKFSQGPSDVDGVWTSWKDWLADCLSHSLHHNALCPPLTRHNDHMTILRLSIEEHEAVCLAQCASRDSAQLRPGRWLWKGWKD